MLTTVAWRARTSGQGVSGFRRRALGLAIRCSDHATANQFPQLIPLVGRGCSPPVDSRISSHPPRSPPLPLSITTISPPSPPPPVVADEHVGEAVRLLQIAQELDDLLLHRAVERRGRLVENDELRDAGSSRGRWRCAGAGRRRTRADSGCAWPDRAGPPRTPAPRACRAPAGDRRLVDEQPLGDDLARGHARRKRAERILEHHLQLPAERPHAPRSSGMMLRSSKRTRPAAAAAAGWRGRASTCRSRTRRRCRSSRPAHRRRVTPSTARSIVAACRGSPPPRWKSTRRSGFEHDRRCSAATAPCVRSGSASISIRV